jgi:hypothetical protein
MLGGPSRTGGSEEQIDALTQSELTEAPAFLQIRVPRAYLRFLQGS